MKKIVMIFAKIFAFLNGISLLLLFGGTTSLGKAGGILSSESIWKYYYLVISIFLTLGFISIILGIIIKINNYEIPQEVKRTRGYNSLSNMLIFTSLIILFIVIASVLSFNRFA